MNFTHTHTQIETRIKKSACKCGCFEWVDAVVDAVVDGCLDTIKTYDYEDHIHRRIIVVLYCFHIYLCLEIMLVVAAATARWLLSAELEPQFNEPYLSTSLQDFWGRRWNLMVMRMPRPTVYPCLTGQRRFISIIDGR
ncbi:hypothetical protein MIMGU_mgv11b023119mg [Erythranthe guttata]|uniref:Wax synthase domain-containing protein n=1 Tax=Erythranthe guttata TaxID=4155 RepID=A0A022QHX9_ERYGU|nr:hypothetical protein MIMGU_mgv11b023119mg [Erythranthe guttata]